MLDSLLILLQNLPFGLLLAALLLDAFIVSKNRREVEPAVLWLLFCSICAAGVVVVVTMVMFFFKGDTSRLHDGGWGLALAALASLGWYFKRQARNRGVLTLRERFFGSDPREAPKPRSGQYFWIVGWRFLAVASLAAGIGSLLRIKPAVSLSKFESASSTPAAAQPPAAGPATPATPPAQGAEGTPAPASADNPTPKPETVAVPAPAGQAPANPPAPDQSPATPPATPANPPADVAMTDPTRDDPSAAPGPAPETPAAPAMNPGMAQPVVTPPPPPPAETARPVSRNSAYFSKVRPILAKACIKCHGKEKQKGDLALHTPDAIRAGINGKPCIIPGDPAKSRIYACVILPPDDPDFMPQKGQPLSISDKKVLFDWIKSGADLGDGVSIPGGGGGSFVVDSIAEGLADIPAPIMDSLTKDHVIVRPLSKNKRVVELDFSHSDRVGGDLKLADLAPIALNVYALDFTKTKIRDADFVHLAGMRNLARLILSRTEITDAALAHLKANASLEHINLYSTPITDAGLTHLQSLKALKKLYLWQSKATDAGAKQLMAAVPGLVISIGSSEPVMTPPPK